MAAWASALLAIAAVPHGLPFCVHAPLVSAPRTAVRLLAKKPGSAKRKAAGRAAVSGKGFGAVSPEPAPAPESASAQRTLADRRTEWSDLNEWVSASGASCDAVELYVDGDGLRGIRTTRRVPRGAELLRIPRAIILDEGVADASSVGRIWTEPGVAGVATPPPPYARLALLLLHEMRRGDASPYAAYLRLLPSPADFSREGGPTVLWEKEELQLLECGKLIDDTLARRARVEASPLIGARALASRWGEHGLAGLAPTEDELRWAVAAVTSRAYGAQQEDGTSVSLLIPMVDMANHAHPPNTAKGLDGSDFVVLAAQDLPSAAQVFLSYGPLPNQLLLSQFGFVVPTSPTDFGIVRCDALADPAAPAATLAAIEAAAAKGLLMREAGGAVSAWQPAGPQLRQAVLSLAEASALPTGLTAIAVADSSAEDAAAAAYSALLKATLGAYSTSVGDDQLALKNKTGLEPRARLALMWRAEQKALLNRELAAVAAAGLRPKSSSMPP